MDSSKTKLRSEISFFNIKFQEFCLENLINFANIFFLRRIIDQFLKFLEKMSVITLQWFLRIVPNQKKEDK